MSPDKRGFVSQKAESRPSGKLQESGLKGIQKNFPGPDHGWLITRKANSNVRLNIIKGINQRTLHHKCLTSITCSRAS